MLLFSRVDLLLVKALGGSEEVAGFYGAAQNITIVPGSFFNAAFAPLLLATPARALREGRAEDARIVTGHAIRGTLSILPFVAIAAGASQEIAPLLYGAAFQPAAALFALLAFAALALSVISVNTAVLTAYGKPRMTFMLAVPLVLLAVAAHVILIPRFGAVGAAMVTAILAWVGACATLLAVRRYTGVFPSPASVLRVGGVTAAAFLTANILHTEGVWVVMELACLSGLALAALYLLQEVTRSDLDFARSLLKRQQAMPVEHRR
jgi:O-antigen/teichoic acid export membrane protein